MKEGKKLIKWIFVELRQKSCFKMLQAIVDFMKREQNYIHSSLDLTHLSLDLTLD